VQCFRASIDADPPFFFYLCGCFLLSTIYYSTTRYVFITYYSSSVGRKGLVAAVADDYPLTLMVARGSGVMDRHETAVVDLCQQTGTDDKEVENCVVDFLTGGYEDIVDDVNNNDEYCNQEDDDAECLLDNMMNMWNDELPPPSTSTFTDPQTEEMEAKKVKPWSSRSSGSGTYVRDPVTGEMRNIDA
jgi:hypothetical protein